MVRVGKGRWEKGKREKGKGKGKKGRRERGNGSM
jgi:hypothetical protein